jgi:hypothetical protein
MSSARRRPHQRRGVRADEAGGGPGEPAAGFTLSQETSVTIAEQIAATEALIVDLGTRRQAAVELSDQAKAERGRVALAAAEGDADAQAVLDQATATAIKAALDAENLDMAAAAARERLADLQEQAEIERLAREREEALAICDQCRVAAQRVDQALAALGSAITDWQATTPVLERYGRQGQAWLHHINIDGREYLSNAAVNAMGYEAALRMGFRHVAHDTVLPLVETDAVLLYARRQRGEEVDTTRPELRRSPPRIKGTISDQPSESATGADGDSWRYDVPPDPAPGDDEDDQSIGIGLPDRAA